MNKLFLILLIPFISINCGDNAQTSKQNANNFSTSAEFNNYWYAGKAELTSYKLYQARYGEMRQGTAVTVFVAEDFSKKKQVKLDDPSKAGNDAIKVLKLNLVKKFVTGIYPYSMMMSVFKPIDTTQMKHAIKLDISSQEWCGNYYAQLDNEKKNYQLHVFSYFESDYGQRDKTLPKVWLEDELWDQIRLDPAVLPTGQIKIIPGFLQQRLLNSSIDAQDATANLVKDCKMPDWLPAKSSTDSYEIDYKNPNRSLIIYFTDQFPYSIVGWQESYLDPFGKQKKVLTTRAIRMKTMQIDYWRHHDNIDASLRDSLNLEEHNQ